MWPRWDLATKYAEFGEMLRKAVQEKIDDEYGLEIPQLVIVNISLPEAVEKASRHSHQHRCYRRSWKVPAVPDGSGSDD